MGRRARIGGPPRALALLATSLAAWGCAGSPSSPHDAPGGVGAVETAELPRFVDVASEVGLDRPTRCGNPVKTSLLETLGSGVAVEDYDGDGDLDVYIGTAQPLDDWLAGRRPLANALYRNRGDGRFDEVAVEAGVDLRAWTTGVGFADVDGDDDMDLFVSAWGRNTLFVNDGDGRFHDGTVAAGLDGAEGWNAGFAFGDLDGDGDLDLWITRYCRIDPASRTTMVWKGLTVPIGPRGLPAEHDLLYRNEGGGRFSEVSTAAGLRAGEPRYGLGVVLSDLDLDGDLDAYVANDSTSNELWRNDGRMHFTERATVAGVATNEDAREQAGMGVDSGDYDGDGLFDVVVTNFSQDFNTLYRNRGGLSFVDATFVAGFRDSFTRLSWGARFADWDDDGLLDLVVANGHIYPEVDAAPHLNTGYREPLSLYRNQGDGTFVDRAAETGAAAELSSSRGLVAADVDGDGDLDLLITRIDDRPALLRNEGGDRLGWLIVRLRGSGANRHGIGARIVVDAGGRRQVRELHPFGSYLSQSPHEIHVGLGRAERVDRLEVDWPSGTVDVHRDLPARSRVLLVEGGGREAIVR